MRWFFGIALALHGVAHLVGFAVSWQLVASPELPYKTTLAMGSMDVGPTGMKLVGLLWLALSAAFVVAAAATVMASTMALPLALATIVASLVTCAISLPEARVGLAINVLLTVFLAFAPKAGLEVYENGEATPPPARGVRR